MSTEPATKKQKIEMSSSWIEVKADSSFPIQNLPWGVFSPAGADSPRIGVAIGDFALDVKYLVSAGLFKTAKSFKPEVLNETVLNGFMALGRTAWKEAREILTNLLDSKNTDEAQKAVVRKGLHPLEKVKMHLPARIGDYTDFYSSKNHAFNLGSLFRDPSKALLSNYLHLPVGYHGRASSVVISGTDLRRPWGQKTPADEETGTPPFEPCKLMDFELEMAFFVGPPTELGKPAKIDSAMDHLFGLVVMNDWSARDIQKWEYAPLGPFTAKNFGTTVSPWIVTMEALEPFRKPVLDEFEPKPQPYLQTKDGKHYSYDINLEVHLTPQDAKEPFVISKGNANGLYWTFEQQLVHHTISGCNMQPGDLCGSGTISGKEPQARGSMIEISWAGRKPLDLPDGTQRKFLLDNDTVNLHAFAQGDGYRIGFGHCIGKVLPALSAEELMGAK